MKFSAASLVLFAAGALAQLMINTPTGALSAIQCSPFQITWTGGQGPFEIRLLDQAQNFLEEITASTNASPFLWTVNIPSGTQVIFSIHDSVGATSSSAPFTIQTSSNTACLSASGSSSASSTPAGTSSSASSASVSAPLSSSASTSAPASSSAPISTRPTSAPISTASTPASSTRPLSSATLASASTTPSASQTSGATPLVAGLFAPLVGALLALAA
ncbi:hypothetical protein K488DRAFT_72503 [Vararia minispora EC-137]|uniref:Uncharacterized protein n=1 Tax=Vararia minispora EC-137 TaxID=1314806 RepID=A0ACB8QFG4_9AGAM|nr:hypothetical protein K488DRAFT_72503 [Vararia minispora EC-137]